MKQCENLAHFSGLSYTRASKIVMPRSKTHYEPLAVLATGKTSKILLSLENLPDGSSRLVVLKKVNPELTQRPEARQGFLSEAQAGSLCNHANLTRVWSVGTAKGNYFAVLEFLLGDGLGLVMSEAHKRGRRLLPEMAAGLMAWVCDALHHLHQLRDPKGMPLHRVHRAVCPENILVLYDGGVKLLGFGGGDGPEAYRSPEQARGQPTDLRSDVFSSGVVLWELLSGRRLFAKKTPEESLRAIAACDIPPVRKFSPEVPSPLETVVRRALQKNPASRFASAGQMAMELRDFFSRAVKKSGEAAIAEFASAAMGERIQRKRELVKEIQSGRAKPTDMVLLAPDTSTALPFPALEERGAAPSAPEAARPQPPPPEKPRTPPPTQGPPPLPGNDEERTSEFLQPTRPIQVPRIAPATGEARPSPPVKTTPPAPEPPPPPAPAVPAASPENGGDDEAEKFNVPTIPVVALPITRPPGTPPLLALPETTSPGKTGSFDTPSTLPPHPGPPPMPVAETPAEAGTGATAAERDDSAAKGAAPVAIHSFETRRLRHKNRLLLIGASGGMLVLLAVLAIVLSSTGKDDTTRAPIPPPVVEAAALAADAGAPEQEPNAESDAGPPAGALDAGSAIAMDAGARPDAGPPVAEADAGQSEADAAPRALTTAVGTPRPAPQTGFLRLNTEPWSEVYLKGKKLGVTPLVDVKLPAGTHALSLVNPKKGINTTLSVTIKPGKTTSLVKELSE